MLNTYFVFGSCPLKLRYHFILLDNDDKTFCLSMFHFVACFWHCGQLSVFTLNLLEYCNATFNYEVSSSLVRVLQKSECYPFILQKLQQFIVKLHFDFHFCFVVFPLKVSFEFITN